MKRFSLTSAVLSSIILAVIGCGQSGTSLTTNDTPVKAQLDVPKKSDFKSSQPEDNVSGQLAVGNRAPDFEVEVLGGELLRLSSYWSDAGGPTVLLFDRANW